MAERRERPAAGPIGELRDCTWCGSAASIERGVCQVCLMWFPDEPGPPVPAGVQEPVPLEDEAGPMDRPAVGG